MGERGGGKIEGKRERGGEREGGGGWREREIAKLLEPQPYVLTGQCSCTVGVSGESTFCCLLFVCAKEKCFCLIGLALRGPDCCFPLEREGLLGGGGLPSVGGGGGEEGGGKRGERERWRRKRNDGKWRKNKAAERTYLSSLSSIFLSLS